MFNEVLGGFVVKLYGSDTHQGFSKLCWSGIKWIFFFCLEMFYSDEMFNFEGFLFF